ncbi:MAG: spinster family MFS transporter [Candidatus Flexifilum sp.]|jgi:MFS family permease
MTSIKRYRYGVVAIFVAFMLLHQADKLLIGQVLTDFSADFGIDDTAAGAVGTGALVVGALFYPIWGFLNDKFSRARLLALASFIWGSTTWLSAVVRTFPAFLLTRSSTGIDDSSYPGIYSLISDYFEPKQRGRINGLLQLTAPVGFVLSLILVLALRDSIGWRAIFLITGGLGIVVGILILLFVRDVPRGRAEPELADLPEIGSYTFRWRAVKALLRKRTLLPLLIQGFFGVFPLNVITFWFFTYLERERRYDSSTVFILMGAAVVLMAIGAFLGGLAGDLLSKRTPRGRLIVAALGVGSAMTFLTLALLTPFDAAPLAFGLPLIGAAFFTLFSGPNVVASIHEIAVPEVRSTALAFQYFVENIGAAAAPFIVGVLSTAAGLPSAILIVCLSTYALCLVFLIAAAWVSPADFLALRQDMARRSQEIQAAEAGGAA